MARTSNLNLCWFQTSEFRPHGNNLFKMRTFFHNSLQAAANGIPSHKTPMMGSLHRFQAVKLLSCQATSHKVKAPSILRKCPDSFAHFLLAWILWISANQITGNWLNDQLQAWIFKAFPRPCDVTQVVFSQYEIQDFTLSPITDDLLWIVELVKRLPAFAESSQNLYKDPLHALFFHFFPSLPHSPSTCPLPLHQKLSPKARGWPLCQILCLGDFLV